MNTTTTGGTDMKKKANCTCIIRHAVTAEERTDALARLREARELHDTIGIMLAINLLARCPDAEA